MAAADILFGAEEENKQTQPKSAADLLFASEDTGPAPSSTEDAPPSPGLTPSPRPAVTVRGPNAPVQLDVPEATAARYRESLTDTMDWVFDKLSRGQYASAAAFNALIEGRFDEVLPDAASGARGDLRLSYGDIAHEKLPDYVPDWMKTALGFVGDVALDPTTYIGIGAISKGARALDSGRSLVSFAGHAIENAPVIGRAATRANELIFGTAREAGQAIRNTPWGRELAESFSTRGTISDEELWRRYREMQQTARYFADQAIKQNVPLEQAVRDLERVSGVDRGTLLEMIENPYRVETLELVQEPLPLTTTETRRVANPFRGKEETLGQVNQQIREPEVIGRVTERVSNFPDAPPEAQRLADYFDQINTSQLRVEQAAGINVKALETKRGLRYMGHYMTPEARAAMKDMDASDWERVMQVTVQHRSTKPRQLRELTASEVNELPDATKKRLFGTTGDIFETDPVKIQTIRDTLSARSLAAAEFLDDVLENPNWAARAENAPSDWRELSDGVKRLFGSKVEGYKFSPEVAEVFSQYVQKAFEPENIHAFIRAYDNFLGAWKIQALATPRWIMNNIKGNVFNGVLLAGMNPARLIDGLRVLTGTGVHKVAGGETLSSVAQRYNTTVDELVSLNGIRDPDFVREGAELVVPSSKPYKAGGKEYSMGEIRELAARHGVTSQGLFGSQMETALRDSLREGAGSGLLRIHERASRPVFNANRVVEDHNRLSLFLDGLKKGYEPEEAANRVKKYLFDYRELTEFEQNVAKRFAPFYTWMRKNIPLQMEHMITTPGKYSAIPKYAQARAQGQPFLQAQETLPEYMQELPHIQTGVTPEGYTEFESMYAIPGVEFLQYINPQASDPSQFFRVNEAFAMNPALSSLLSLGGYIAFQNRTIEPDEAENFLGLGVLPARTSEAIFQALPVLRNIQGIVQPGSSDPLAPQETYWQALAQFLTGTPKYYRNPALDAYRWANRIPRDIGYATGDLEDALLLGDDMMTEYRMRALMNMLSGQ